MTTDIERPKDPYDPPIFKNPSRKAPQEQEGRSWEEIKSMNWADWEGCCICKATQKRRQKNIKTNTIIILKLIFITYYSSPIQTLGYLFT